MGGEGVLRIWSGLTVAMTQAQPFRVSTSLRGKES